MKFSVKSESKLLAKHSAIYGIGEFLNKFVAFLLIPLYTKYLTPSDYGIKELLGITTDVIGTLTAVAITSAIYRFYFEYDNEKEKNEVISSAILSIGLIGLVFLSPLCFFSDKLSFYILDSNDLYYYFWISFSSLWFQSLNNISFGYMRANRQSVLFIVTSLCRLVLNIFFNIYFIVFAGYGVLGILLSTLIVSFLTTLSITIPLLLKIKLRFSKAKTLEMIKFGLPNIPAQFGAFAVHLSDRFFIKAICSLSDTGIYSLGYRFGTLPGTFISGPFNRVWMPRRLEMAKREDSGEIFGRIFSYFLLLMVFAGLSISILIQDVLVIMADSRYWEAYKIVPIIVLSNILFSFQDHFNIGILLEKKTKYLAYINLSNGLLILILNYFLISAFGFMGAAYATLIAMIYKISLTYYFSNRLIKIHFEFIRVLKIFSTGAMIYGLSSFINFQSIFLNMTIKTQLLFIFPAILYFLGFFTDIEKEKALGFFGRYTSIWRNR